MSNEEVIWESTLDDVYHCCVTRQSDRKGNLRVKNIETNKLIIEEEVSLAYGAIMGPDIDDVSSWEQLCCNVVDNE